MSVRGKSAERWALYMPGTGRDHARKKSRPMSRRRCADVDDPHRRFLLFQVPVVGLPYAHRADLLFIVANLSVATFRRSR
jgi:hypothetical protein